MVGWCVKTVSHFSGIACAQYCFFAFDGLPRVEIKSHARKAGVISAWFRSVLQRPCLLVLQAIDVGQAGQGICYGCVLDTIERQPVSGTQRRYRLSTIPQKPMRMAAIVPGS
jgi:hypothetical protein